MARVNPGVGRVYANLGTLLHELGDDAAAREHLARGLALTGAAVGTGRRQDGRASL